MSRSSRTLSHSSIARGDRFFRGVALAPIRFYRRFLSALKPRPTCRYLPTCSEYAVEAIETRGVLVGGLKALGRICRCNPLFHGGYHPVDRQS